MLSREFMLNCKNLLTANTDLPGKCNIQVIDDRNLILLMLISLLAIDVTGR